MKDKAEVPVLFASEWEAGVTTFLPGHEDFEPASQRTIVRMLNAPMPEGIIGLGRNSAVVSNDSEDDTRIYLSNGGVKYRDDEHYEIATGEHDDALEFVANELDNEKIIRHALNYLVEKGWVDKAILDSKVLDHEGNSWGYHLNFLLERVFLDLAQKEEIAKNPLAQHFALFLATWGMITGEGGIGRSIKGKGHQFYVHTKASTITPGAEFGTETTGPKTLFNTRDEPHADPEKYIRLHVISPDFTASPWAKRMSVSMAALVLKALVLGLRTQPKFEFQPGDLVKVAKTVASDPTCREEVELADRRKIKPIEIQRAFLSMAQQVGRSRDLSADDTWVLGQWEAALDQLEADPMGLTLASWTHKFSQLNALQQREGGWSAEKVLAADHMLARIGPNTTIDRRRRNVGIKGRGDKKEEVEIDAWADHMPPANRKEFQPSERTRSRLRALAVRKLVKFGWLDPAVAWDHVSTYNAATQDRNSFRFLHPQISSNEEFEEYLQSL